MFDQIKSQTIAFMMSHPYLCDDCWIAIQRIAEPILGIDRWDQLWLDGCDIVHATWVGNSDEEEIGGILWCNFFFDSFKARCTREQILEFEEKFVRTPFYLKTKYPCENKHSSPELDNHLPTI